MPISVIKSGAACGAQIVFDLSQPIDESAFREIERRFTTTSSSSSATRSSLRSNKSRSAAASASSKSTSSGNTCCRIARDLLISNVRNEAGEHIGLADAGFTWHSDTSYRRLPSRCSLLYAKEVPDRDGKPLGDTLFANTIAAYEALPEAMKRRLAGLKAIHRYSMRRRVENSPRPKLTAAQVAETPDILHPIVRTHPSTGRRRSTSPPASASASRACPKTRRWT